MSGMFAFHNGAANKNCENCRNMVTENSTGICPFLIFNCINLNNATTAKLLELFSYSSCLRVYNVINRVDNLI